MHLLINHHEPGEKQPAFGAGIEFMAPTLVEKDFAAVGLSQEGTKYSNKWLDRGQSVASNVDSLRQVLNFVAVDTTRNKRHSYH